jgi:hypothetical protein
VLGEEIKKGVREVRLTVSWSEGARQESFTVVTHLVVLVPGSQQPAAAAAAAAAAGGGGLTVPAGTDRPGFDSGKWINDSGKRRSQRAGQVSGGQE